MEFKEKISLIRDRLGLSQKDLARRLGIARATVNRLEKGHFQPNYKVSEAVDALYRELFETKIIPALERRPIIAAGDLKRDVSEIIESAKRRAMCNINVALVQRNFLIGKRIEEEILSSRSEDYGKEIIKNLSALLTDKYGDGFDPTSLYRYLRFSKAFPDILASVRQESFLSWTHYRILVTVDSDVARTYYEKEALACGWSVRDLQRAIHSQYYERLLSTHRGEPPYLPTGVAPPKDPLEYIKSPVVAEFLGLPDPGKFNESTLEQAIIDHLTQFLLELGKGYAFVARQKRIHTEKKDYYVDLVFYN